MDLFTKLKNFDVYPKVHSDMTIKTISGAFLSLVSIFFMLVLFLSELNAYLTVQTVDRLSVDTTLGKQLKIQFNISYPYLPCSLLSVDAMDISGNHQFDLYHSINKYTLDENMRVVSDSVLENLGNTMSKEDMKELKERLNSTTTTDDQSKPKEEAQPPAAPIPSCGSCYGAEAYEGQCCNTCDHVREAYRHKGWHISDLGAFEQCAREGQSSEAIAKQLQEHRGCRLAGYLNVNKVAGNLHFAPGKSSQHSSMHFHDIASLSNPSLGVIFNLSHIIHSFNFGESYDGIINPLDSRIKIMEEKDRDSGMYMYYLKIVPTTYKDANNKLIETNQYSVTEYYRPVHGHEQNTVPGVFFFYELSPISIEITQTSSTFLHFCVQVCAICGGVFTVTSLIDRLLYQGMRHMQAKKAQ